MVFRHFPYYGKIRKPEYCRWKNSRKNSRKNGSAHSEINENVEVIAEVSNSCTSLEINDSDLFILNNILSTLTSS
jgi:hypothetical protein